MYKNAYREIDEILSLTDKYQPKKVQKKDKNILIIDDSQYVLKSLKAGLKHFGFNVTTIQNTQKIIALLRKIKVDVILLDVHMNGLSGLQIMKKINKFNYLKKIPVIILSCHISEDLVIKTGKLGAVDYILKPIKPSELAIRISEVLDNGRKHKMFNAYYRRKK